MDKEKQILTLNQQIKESTNKTEDLKGKLCAHETTTNIQLRNIIASKEREWLQQKVEAIASALAKKEQEWLQQNAKAEEDHKKELEVLANNEKEWIS